MSSKFLGYVVAGALASAIALASPVLARGGGGGGGGGGWGGGGGMGMGGHSMGMAGGWSGGMHSMGMVGHPMGARSFAAMPMSRAAFAPRFSHATFVPHHPFFHHRFHRFNRFAFVGFGGYGYGYYDDCWRRVWTAYGPQWVNLCSDYGYGY